MKKVSTIFNQLLDFLPKNQFQSFVGQHKADKYVKTFSCWQQLLTLLYAQATSKNCLREIELGLRMHFRKWYHLGLDYVARSTISYANNTRPYQIYENLFYELLKKCHDLNPERKFNFKNDLYSVDATTINLCLSLFNWAKFRKQKGAIKLHTLFNNKTQIPEFLSITQGKTHEFKEAEKNWKKWDLPKESFLVFDKGYICYKWFNDLNEEGIYFVSRIKKNTNYFVIKDNQILEEGILADQIVGPGGDTGMEEYREDLRLITYFDKETKKIYYFLTNNFELSAGTIADIYKDRWQIELFFKWIKQNLKIKTFLGTSKNAVLTQIWIAMIYYLLLSYIKFKTNLKISLTEFTRIIKEVLMDRIPLIDVLGIPFKKISVCKARGSPEVLSLF